VGQPIGSKTFLINKAINQPKALFFVTEDWYFLSHRIELAKGLLQAGFQVSIAASLGPAACEIKRLGFRVTPCDFHRASLNPVLAGMTLRNMNQVLKYEQPNVVFFVALRPIFLSAFLKIKNESVKIIYLVCGFGTIINQQDPGLKNSVLRYLFLKLLKIACRRKKSVVVVQNTEDYKLFKEKICTQQPLIKITGTGIEIKKVSAGNSPPSTFSFIYLGRLIRQKGLNELFQAFRLVRLSYPDVKLLLYGECDPANPSSLNPSDIKAAKQIGNLHFCGSTRQPELKIKNAHCLVLPSYAEGFPRVVLQAARCGTPVIVSDAGGCREMVRHKIHGLIVRKKDPLALARAMEWMVVNPNERRRLGCNLNRRAFQKFCASVIVPKFVGLIHAKS